MMRRKAISLKSLISHRIPLAKLPETIRMMQERRELFRKVMVIF